MFNLFKLIDYSFKARKGINNTEELVSDVSFGPLEGLFVFSFIILTIFVLGFGFLGIHFSSGIALFFSILFLLILGIDIFIFIKIKFFFKRISSNVVDYSKKKYRRIKENNIIDVDYE